MRTAVPEELHDLDLALGHMGVDRRRDAHIVESFLVVAGLGNPRQGQKQQ